MYNVSKSISKYMKKRWAELKEEIDKSTPLVSNSESFPTLMDRTRKNYFVNIWQNHTIWSSN